MNINKIEILSEKKKDPPSQKLLTMKNLKKSNSSHISAAYLRKTTILMKRYVIG